MDWRAGHAIRHGARIIPECTCSSSCSRHRTGGCGIPCANRASGSGRLMRTFLQKKARLLGALLIGVLLLMGAGDSTSRVEKLGHQLMCVCSCGQILMECNHVGCTYSDTMRKELAAGVDGGKSDSEVLAMFVEKYGTT